MRNPLIIPLSTFLALTLTSCDAATAVRDPAFDGPALQAERFVHFEAFLLGGDPAFPLALQAGFEDGVTPQVICDDPGSLNPLGEGFLLFTPSGRTLLHISSRDANFVVYSFAGGPVTSACDLVGAPVVGTGTGKFSYHISESASGKATIHVTAIGTINMVSGGQARVHATAQVIIRPGGSLLRDEERVRLSPI